MNITFETKSLGDVATYINGRAFKPNEWEKSGIPIIRIQNLTDSNAPCNYSQKIYDEKFLIQKGDLLFAWAASLGAHIWQGGDAWLNQHIFKIIPHDNVYKKYLYYFLLKTIDDLYRKTHGSGMVHITKKPFMSTPIPIPPFTQQERIVSKIEELFSEIDNVVSSLQEANQKLAIYRQAALQNAYSSIENRTFCHLGDILESKPKNGYSPKSVAYETPYKNLTLTATTGGIFRDGFYKHIDLNIDKDSYLWVKKNDILIQRANAIDHVGTAALYTGMDNQYVYPDLMMKCRTKEGILPSFVVYQLQSSNCKKYFRKHATGTAGSMPKINQKTVISVPIVIADIQTQEKTVQYIEHQFAACFNLELTIQKTQERLTALRQSILKKAFEGDLI